MSLGSRHAARKFVRVGKERAFLGNFVDVADQHIVVAEALDDLLAGQAFRAA